MSQGVEQMNGSTSRSLESETCCNYMFKQDENDKYSIIQAHVYLSSIKGFLAVEACRKNPPLHTPNHSYVPSNGDVIFTG